MMSFIVGAERVAKRGHAPWLCLSRSGVSVVNFSLAPIIIRQKSNCIVMCLNAALETLVTNRLQ